MKGQLGHMFVRKISFSSIGKNIPKGNNIFGKHGTPDSFSNVTPKIVSYIGQNIYLRDGNPISLLREKIVNFFYTTFKGRSGNPIFSVADNLNPVVSVENNFDLLLVPSNHVSREKNDCYYVNKDYLLRSHMTAHQCDLMKQGLSNFLMVGDVYRRDEIDSTHFPVFHQLDCVRLQTAAEIFLKKDCGKKDLTIFKNDGYRTTETQENYSVEASNTAEQELKNTLENLSRHLFGENVQMKWVDAYFPFTHPSWELEIFLNDKWIEVLGCGIMEHGILKNGGCTDRIGWAFGLGLERLAMILYKIPDIRLFWSNDTGFLTQFKGKTCHDAIVYNPISVYPQCKNDISFWVPDGFSSNDFYDLARDIGGDIVEQIQLVDVFSNSKTGLTSHCYTIIYRHMEKSLTKEEVNNLHKKIETKASEILKVKIR